MLKLNYQELCNLRGELIIARALHRDSIQNFEDKIKYSGSDPDTIKIYKKAKELSEKFMADNIALQNAVEKELKENWPQQ